MNKVQIFGILTIIAGLGIAFITERSDYQFISWIMAAFGIGWACTGSFTVSRRKTYTESSSK